MCAPAQAQTFYGGPATGATLGFPEGTDVDAAGNLLVADVNEGRVREISRGSVTING